MQEDNFSRFGMPETTDVFKLTHPSFRLAAGLGERMDLPETDTRSMRGVAVLPAPRGRLFRKYVALFVAVVCAALAAKGLLDGWFSFQEQKALLGRIQHEQAMAAAMRIGLFVKEIQGQLGWATQFPWSANAADDWQLDSERLLRQVEAITELRQLDAEGREQFCNMRFAVCATDAGPTDFSRDPSFVEAVANGVYFGPVHFLRESEPYMTIAMRGQRRSYGVIVAQVNLKFIWDVVNDIKVGATGRAFVVDPDGRLIAHPEINPGAAQYRHVSSCAGPGGDGGAFRGIVGASDGREFGAIGRSRRRRSPSIERTWAHCSARLVGLHRTPAG
jgi:Cache domain